MAKTKIVVNSNGSVRLEGDFEIWIKTEVLMILEEEKLFLFADAAFQKINLFAMALITDTLSTMLLPLRCHQKNKYYPPFNQPVILILRWFVTKTS